MCDRFFTKKTGASICTHALDEYGWRSAVVSTLRGRMMCWTVQEHRENPATLISHTALPMDQMRDRKSDGWRRYEVRGRVVLMHNMGPMT